MNRDSLMSSNIQSLFFSDISVMFFPVLFESVSGWDLCCGRPVCVHLLDDQFPLSSHSLSLSLLFFLFCLLLLLLRKPNYSHFPQNLACLSLIRASALCISCKLVKQRVDWGHVCCVRCSTAVVSVHQGCITSSPLNVVSNPGRPLPGSVLYKQGPFILGLVHYSILEIHESGLIGCVSQDWPKSLSVPLHGRACVGGPAVSRVQQTELASKAQPASGCP